VEFIIHQTDLTTISCAGEYVKKLIDLRKDNKAASLKNIITFDAIDEGEF